MVYSVIDVAKRAIRRAKNSISFAGRFKGSANYWERRYSSWGNSGAGSYGDLAEFKAKIINEFIHEKGISSVIEFGCGDGNQLALADYLEYLGIDVSPTIITRCKKRHSSDSSKSFMLLKDYRGETAELSLSLDVIYHLVEDTVYGAHMRLLFSSARRFVIIYSSNFDEKGFVSADHVRHRRFLDWIRSNVDDWRLIDKVDNKHPFDKNSRVGSLADFYIFAKESGVN